MLKNSLSMEKSQKPLTAQMAERILQQNADFFKSRGLTPTGKLLCNQKPLSKALLQKGAAGEVKRIS